MQTATLQSPGGESAAALYTRLETLRDPYLRRARASAKLTIPSLLLPEGHTDGQDLYTPHQSVGAEGVNNIASKLLLTLMQPGSPFFRTRPTPEIQREFNDLDERAVAAGRPPASADFEKALAEYERLVMHDIEDKGDRTVAFEMLKHLIVCGNVLHFQDTSGSRLWHLDRYVVRRDPMGQVLDIVIKEEFAPDNLPEDVRDIVADSALNGSPSAIETTIPVYTHISRKENQWFEYQEVEGQRIPDSEAQYPLDRTPYLPLRLVRVDGAHYGRGYIEEYFGDLKVLEMLSKAVAEGMVALSKILFLVRPNGTTQAKTLAESPNGAIRQGNADDVSVVQSQKAQDLRAAESHIDRIERRLARAFLMDTVVQRDAERVTAEEIRRMSQMLEDSLGGVYSLLTQEFQLPFVQRRIAIMQRSGALPRLPKGYTRISIVTGIEALGRNHDRQRLVEYAGMLKQLLTPEQYAMRLNDEDLAKRLAVADGIDTEGLINSDQQIQEKQQAMQQQQMGAQLAPELVKQGGGMMQAAMRNQSQQPQEQPQ